MLARKRRNGLGTAAALLALLGLQPMMLSGATTPCPSGWGIESTPLPSRPSWYGTVTWGGDDSAWFPAPAVQSLSLGVLGSVEGAPVRIVLLLQRESVSPPVLEWDFRQFRGTSVPPSTSLWTCDAPLPLTPESVMMTDYSPRLYVYQVNIPWGILHFHIRETSGAGYAYWQVQVVPEGAICPPDATGKECAPLPGEQLTRILRDVP